MKKLRWGIIGAGDIVRKRIIGAIRSDKSSELVAVARANAELAEEFAREFGISRWYANHREMISDDEIDAIYVASPVFLHSEHAIAAAEAGKHVLCEKPMAMDRAECSRMIAASEANGVRLGVAYYRRYYPVIARIRQALAGSEIGRPVVVQMNTFEAFDPEPEHPRRWFIEKEKSGGGPMMDFGCHRIEILLDLFGKPIRVEAINANAILGREVEDTSMALFEFESGVCGSLSVTHAAAESIDRFDIYGTSGSMHIASLNKGQIEITTPAGTAIESHPPSENFHVPLIEDFSRAVIEGRDAPVSGKTGEEVAAIVDAIYGR